MVDFGNILEKVMHELVPVMRRESVDLSYSIEAFVLPGGFEATVTFHGSRVALRCPECQKEVDGLFRDWKNKPGQKGTIYICPSCYDAILEKNHNLG
jgi:NAD-dependent SIR2 family protein deacetylase